MRQNYGVARLSKTEVKKCKTGIVFAISLTAIALASTAHAEERADRYIRRVTTNVEQSCDAIAHPDLHLKCLNSLTQLKTQQLERLKLQTCLDQRQSYEWGYSQIVPVTECANILSIWDKSHPEARARELKLLEPLK